MNDPHAPGPTGSTGSPASPATFLTVEVNGVPRQLPVGSTVADLVRSLGLPTAQVAVERNRLIVRRADHGQTLLQAGDRLEVVTLFGGG